MSPADNVMQIFSELPRTNCRRCGEKTCLAFAGRVFKGERPIRDCPFLDDEAVARFAAAEEQSPDEREEHAGRLRQQLESCDLAAAASRTGGRFDGSRLTVKVLGKDLSVDPAGNFYSDIHLIPWVTVPFLTYVLTCSGAAVSGDWRSFRELRGGPERYPLFAKRCEEGMKRVADSYTALFDDLVHLFQGRQIGARFEADISVVLPVFPKVPLMICYWEPDEGMGSSLNIFFDRSIDDNLGAEQAFTLGSGLTQMFEKLALRHGCQV